MCKQSTWPRTDLHHREFIYGFKKVGQLIPNRHTAEARKLRVYNMQNMCSLRARLVGGARWDTQVSTLFFIHNFTLEYNTNNMPSFEATASQQSTQYTYCFRKYFNEMNIIDNHIQCVIELMVFFHTSLNHTHSLS